MQSPNADLCQNSAIWQFAIECTLLVICFSRCWDWFLPLSLLFLLPLICLLVCHNSLLNLQLPAKNQILSSTLTIEFQVCMPVLYDLNCLWFYVCPLLSCLLLFESFYNQLSSLDYPETTANELSASSNSILSLSFKLHESASSGNQFIAQYVALAIENTESHTSATFLCTHSSSGHYTASLVCVDLCILIHSCIRVK